MSTSKHRDRSRSTLRLGFLLAALVWAMAAASYALAAEPRWSLAVGAAPAAPETAVEIPVVLAARGAAVSAIAFSIEFDASKLALDGGPTLGSKVEIPAPTLFTSSSWVGSEAGAIGVVVYDSTRPVGVLGDGTIARIRFRVLPGASGFAAVRISTERPFSASGPRGEHLEGDIEAGGGITIVAPAGSALNAPPSQPVERAPIARPAPDEVPLLAFPIVRESAADGRASTGTSLVLHNGGAERATARLTLVRTERSAPAGPVEVSVPSGATRSWNDAGAELFGIPSSSGALVIERSSSLLLISGSAGAAIDAAPVSIRDARLVALEAAAGRATIAIANLENRAARFALETRGSEGALLGRSEVTVEGSSLKSGLPIPVASASEKATVTVVIRPLESPARFVAWAAAPEVQSPQRLQLAR